MVESDPGILPGITGAVDDELVKEVFLSVVTGTSSVLEAVAFRPQKEDHLQENDCCAAVLLLLLSAATAGGDAISPSTISVLEDTALTLG